MRTDPKDLPVDRSLGVEEISRRISRVIRLTDSFIIRVETSRQRGDGGSPHSLPFAPRRPNRRGHR